MATVKCPLHHRGKPTHEWNDGVKDHIYCMGWIDKMTELELPECLACPDHVSHAQDDLDAFYKRNGESMTTEKAIQVLHAERKCVQRQDCDRNCAACDLVMQDKTIISAYDMAIAALRAQQERENPQPLTEAQIRELQLREWLYIEVIGDCGRAESAYYRVQPDYSRGEALCCGYPGLGFEFDYCDYGKTWFAYRNKPKRD